MKELIYVNINTRNVKKILTNFQKKKNYSVTVVATQHACNKLTCFVKFYFFYTTINILL